MLNATNFLTDAVGELGPLSEFLTTTGENASRTNYLTPPAPVPLHTR